MMTSRERVRAVLNREPVDRLPVDLWHTPEVGAALRSHCGVDSDLAAYRTLGVDKIVWVFMTYRTETGDAAGAQVGAEASGTRTMWGVPLRGVQAGAAHYEEFGRAPLLDHPTIASLDDYPWWPDPRRFDVDDAVRRAEAAARDFAVIGPWVSFFEIYTQMRGVEQAMMDLALDPDYVDAALDRIEAIQTALLDDFLPRAASALDLVFLSDDIAGQTGLIMSPSMWARHLKPRMARWCERIHDHGLKVFYHTDGAARPLLEPILDSGVDVLNPIQHACPGMDCAELKRTFGRRVIFHGGVDNQRVLPFGTPEEVRTETRHVLDTLGAGGEGFICCSCHNVQAGTPVENVLAMIDTVRESG
jgi:uroporphyrinogen decarboxylase